VPGAREVASNSWASPDGHLWLFGGYGRDSAGNTGYLNDLWRYSTDTTLVVTLAEFGAVQQNGAVLVTWETVSEVGNAGFNLYRSDSAAGPLSLLTWLPSQAPGGTVGFAYSYENGTVQPGQILYYFLEDVSLSGATTLHGPVSVTIHTPTALKLASLKTGSQVGTDWGWLLALAASGLALAGALARRWKGQAGLRQVLNDRQVSRRVRRESAARAGRDALEITASNEYLIVHSMNWPQSCCRSR
jgi:hypothetical protein